jgi:hypothetical protein
MFAVAFIKELAVVRSAFPILSAAFALLATAAAAQQHDHSMHHRQAGASDERQLVQFPEPMRQHILANMRDHLLALGEIQGALSRAEFDHAADIAEKRLGMSSLDAHGAHDASRFMPKAMQDVGTSMHRAASQFATIAKDASVTGDLKAPLAALVRVNDACVACHAAFRVH